MRKGLLYVVGFDGTIFWFKIVYVCVLHVFFLYLETKGFIFFFEGTFIHKFEKFVNEGELMQKYRCSASADFTSVKMRERQARIKLSYQR